jgi:hypothetical protein
MAAGTDDMPGRVIQVTPAVGCVLDVSPQQTFRIAHAGSALLGAIVGLADSADPIAAIVLRTLATDANRFSAELLAAGYLVERQPS